MFKAKLTMIRIIFLCLISTTGVQGVSWTVGTSVPTFTEDIKLDCTVPSGCCTSSSRIWLDGNGNLILNNGMSSSPNKYAEDWNLTETSGFSLIIKNLQLSDVGVDYECKYSLGSDKHTLTQDATFKYLPTEKVHWKGKNSRLTASSNISRSAPIPSISALYGGANISADLTVADISNFETWFYSFNVNMDAQISCYFIDKFTLKAVTGTASITLEDELDICSCLPCAKTIYLYAAIGFVLYLVILLIGVVAYMLYNKKNIEDFKEESGKVAAVFGISMIVGFGFNAIFATLYGIYCCGCHAHKDTLWISLGLGTSFLGLLIGYAAVVRNKEDEKIAKFAPLLILLGVEAFLIGLTDLMVIAKHLKGRFGLCGLYSFLWAALGSLLVLIVVSVILNKIKKFDTKKTAFFGVIIFVMSLVVDLTVAVPIGTFVCPSNNWCFIFLGILYSLILFAVFWFGSLLETEEYKILSCLVAVVKIWIPIIVLGCFAVIKKICCKGGNNRSKESGSSCWPPCSVGPDPNSPESENARSLLKKKPDKKNEEKPVAVVRSQPSKNRHVKTDNTESTRYSAETEIFDEGVHKSAKPRPLPSIGQPTNSPRPLPQMPPSSQLEKGGIQLEPLGGSTSEKKKKKRRKKKESKQSDEED